MIWLLMVVVALDPLVLSLLVFELFVFISVALFQRFQREDHWLDRVSPLVGVGIGIGAWIAYAALFVAWFNSSNDLQAWQIIPQLIFMYVGVYLFVMTTASFMAGATRQKPSRFFRPVLIFTVFFYGAMLLLPLQPGL
ncbi:MAG: hypothetical protein F9K39_01720 [Exiguobacterium chiriqhucha]|uniref:hypothetical protein n=1 Tax=Exiguobacterium chiriqhucha TaxID=1385984 RepID=UPI00144CEC80|nr:hypothetical protein [Exiguobacterium chiriqhucha]KAB2865438.1 MAG: hypothetical protein F9K39_01720 [Exiguobacterium chiriqhucha]